MDKKWVALLVFAGFSAAFVIVSALVVLSRRNPWFVAKKLRIGGMLLTLTSMSTLTACPGVIGCYVPPPQEQKVILEGVTNSTFHWLNTNLPAIPVNNATNVQLNGAISNRFNTGISYLLKSNNTLSSVREGDIPFSGGPGAGYDPFVIPIDSNVSPGQYQLEIYNYSLSNLNGSYRNGATPEVTFVLALSGGATGSVASGSSSGNVTSDSAGSSSGNTSSGSVSSSPDYSSSENTSGSSGASSSGI